VTQYGAEDWTITMADGRRMSAADYEGRLAANLGDIRDLADGLDERADTIDYYRTALATAVSGVPAAVGHHAAATTFLNGDGAHHGYRQCAQTALDSIRTLAASVRTVAGDPNHGLRATAQLLFDTEQATLAACRGIQPADPRTWRRG
jgi:hypothetical protein